MLSERMSGLIARVVKETDHNQKTIRAALANLEFEGRVKVDRLPKSAIKVVKLAAKN